MAENIDSGLHVHFPKGFAWGLFLMGRPMAAMIPVPWLFHWVALMGEQGCDIKLLFPITEGVP